MKCVTIIFISVILFLGKQSSFSQTNWTEGELNTKSGVYIVRKVSEDRVKVEKKDYDKRRDWIFGFSQETGMVSITINSEREFLEIIKKVFTEDKLKRLAINEKNLTATILLDEEGFPIHLSFGLRSNSLITPEELIFIESEIIKRIRYTIRREMPFGQPCVYPTGLKINFQDILNGEIPALKNSEQRGNEKAEWEQ